MYDNTAPIGQSAGTGMFTTCKSLVFTVTVVPSTPGSLTTYCRRIEHQGELGKGTLFKHILSIKMQAFGLYKLQCFLPVPASDLEREEEEHLLRHT
jgi:hypothetical protein